MIEPDWFDVATPTVQLRALTWGPPDGPIALCLHGFPDTPYGLRKVAPMLVDAGWRVVAPFMRGYAPSSIPTDGSYHVGALMDDALQVLDAAGPTGRDVVIGHDWGAGSAAGSGRHGRQPVRQGGDHVGADLRGVPSAGQGSRSDPARRTVAAPSCCAAGTSSTSNCLGCLNVPAFGWCRLLWRQWSPGYDGQDEDIPLVEAAIGAPENWRAALGDVPGQLPRHQAAGRVRGAASHWFFEPPDGAHPVPAR